MHTGRLAPANLVDGAHASRVGVSILSHSQDRNRVRPPPPKSVIGHLGAQLLSHRNEIDAAGGDLSKLKPLASASTNSRLSLFQHSLADGLRKGLPPRRTDRNR